MSTNTSEPEGASKDGSVARSTNRERSAIHLLATETSEGRIRALVALLARRYSAQPVFIQAAERAEDWRWKSTTQDLEEVLASGAGPPDRLDDVVVHVSVSNVSALAAGGDLRKALEECRSAVLSVDAVDENAAVELLPLVRNRLDEIRVKPEFMGTCTSSSNDSRCLAIVCRGKGPPFARPPTEFRVVALVTAFNEEDVIADVLRHLIEEGVEVILTDNWSTDDTVARARPFLGEGLLRIVTFPADGPSSSFDLTKLLTHEASLAQEEPASWFIHHDADEIRRGPWPACTLREALYEVDQRGYNAVDHTQLDFHPTEDSFHPGDRLEDSFRYFTPASFIAHDRRVNAWKNTGVPIDLVMSGGHNVQFEGRRVFPYNFLLKHYPVRSQAHGEQKILRERKARWNREERRLGWHFQYDHIRKGHNFLRDPSELRVFDSSFDDRMLVERLSSIGLHDVPRRYSSDTRRLAITALRRSRLLNPALAIQRRIRALRRQDVSLGKR